MPISSPCTTVDRCTCFLVLFARGPERAGSSACLRVALWQLYNKLMVHGLLPGMMAILVGGLGLGVITMCQAELTSAVPFAGGRGPMSASDDPILEGSGWSRVSAAHHVLVPHSTPDPIVGMPHRDVWIRPADHGPQHRCHLWPHRVCYVREPKLVQCCHLLTLFIDRLIRLCACLFQVLLWQLWHSVQNGVHHHLGLPHEQAPRDPVDSAHLHGVCRHPCQRGPRPMGESVHHTPSQMSHEHTKAE